MDADQALAQLSATADLQKAKDMARYHKVARQYLGVANPAIDECAKEWRRNLSFEERLALADALWRSDIHEARVAAAKLLTQARIRPDDTAAWELIKSWVPDFDAWAIADHASSAGQKRLVADPARLNEVEAWTQPPHMWTRGAGDDTALDQKSKPKAGRLRVPGARSRLDCVIRRRSRMVHPESRRLVAARSVEA